MKLRWRLSADEREVAALRRAASGCSASISVRPGTIALLPFAAGTGTTAPGVRLERIHATGREEVVVRNTSRSTVTLTGWVLRDEIGFGQFRIPTTRLGPRRALIVRSTGGSDRRTGADDVLRFADWGDVWNDAGDEAQLIDGTRRVVDTCRYGRGDLSEGAVRCR